MGRAAPPGHIHFCGNPSGGHMLAPSTVAIPRKGTLAMVLENFGSLHQRRVLSRRQTHSLCPESRNFSKAAIIPRSWRKPKDPTLAGPKPSPDPSGHPQRVPRRPGRLRGAPGTGDVSYATLPLQITQLSRKAVGLDSLLSRISA